MGKYQGIQKSSILRPSDLIFAHIEIFGQCYRMYRLFIAITCIISVSYTHLIFYPQDNARVDFIACSYVTGLQFTGGIHLSLIHIFGQGQ